MGSAATKQCFESILCKNKVKPLQRTASTSKSNNEPSVTTALPSFGDVTDYDLETLQQPLHRTAWEEPKEFIAESVATLSTKAEEVVQEIKDTATSRWKLLNLESKRNIPSETPANPGLLHPDSCLDIEKE